VPRYFFDVVDGKNLPDEIGEELSDLAAAKCHAVTYAGRLICDDAADFWGRGEWLMTVADATGLTLFTLVLTGYDSPAANTISIATVAAS
jgi:hypothetical protein